LIKLSIGSPPPIRNDISFSVIESVANFSIEVVTVFMTFFELGLILVLLIVQPFIPSFTKTLPGKTKKNEKKILDSYKLMKMCVLYKNKKCYF